MATSILEESWPEKFLQGAINLQGSSSSAETFFRERGDPEATTISSVAHCCELVTKLLKLSEFPTAPAVSALVLSNGPALEYLDAVAHTPWNTPEELVNSGEEVHAEALKVSLLMDLGFKMDVVKIPGRGKLRGVKYSGVLATIAKAANMNASLNATNICAAAAAGDLLELRWYARRAVVRQEAADRTNQGAPGGALAFNPSGRRVHARDRDGFTPLHHACSNGQMLTAIFLLDHWEAVHDGAPDSLLDRYEDEEAAVEAANARADAFSLAGTKVAGMAAHVDDQSSSSSSSTNQPGSSASDDAGPVLRRMVNMPDLRAGNTALHLCVQNGHLATAKLLLSKGAKPNLRNALGRSALASAAAFGVDEAVVALLVEHGAKGNVKTNFGDTADQVARKAGHKDLAKRIIELEDARRQQQIDAHRYHNDLETAAHM